MPHFTIEAQGETNPLSTQSVLSTLASASGTSANQQTLQTASQQLSNWEKTRGYYVVLQDIYVDFSLGQDVRLQAIIQLKNGIDKYWRKTALHALTKDERERIRARAVEAGLHEPVPALALQNALMLSKIVRYEFPHDWPDVVTTIIRHLRAAEQQSDPRYTSNILTMTLQVIKELASGRLQRTKKSLQQVAPELLHVLAGLYVNLVDRWRTATQSEQLPLMINSHSALKTLRRLLVVGFEHPHREEDARHFWSILQQHHDIFWTVCRQANSDPKIQAMIMKHLFQVSKLYLDMARTHPASFVLLGCMDILTRSWSVISGDDVKAAMSSRVDWDVHHPGDGLNEVSPFEKLALKGLLLFRACVKMVFSPAQTFKYQYPQDKEERTAAIEQVRSGVLTDDFAVQLMEILITQYFVLRPSDLREWDEEPDEWERHEAEFTDAWEFSTRSCSEKLFLDLIINFKELLVPRLLQVFRQYATVDNTDVLLKDSLYSSIGIAAACLEDVFDFNAFLQTTLVPEVQSHRAHYNLLRRRAAILLGQWVPIKPDVLDRRAVYQIFTHLLSTTDNLNDHVVRVTAGRQLHLVLEPFEFSYADFAPYATPILQNLMTLISETELSETKMALLETVRVAVTKLEGHIEPYASGIMSILPTLWTDSGDEHLMKQAILTMITAIVTSLGRKGLPYHSAVLPLIHDAVQPGSEAIVYLLEEALELWAAILQQTSSTDLPAQPQLLALCSSLLPLLEMGSDHLRQTLELFESYTILSPATVLNPAILHPLLISLKSLLLMLSSSRVRDASLAPHVIENLLAVLKSPSSMPVGQQPEAIQHLVALMVETGYLAEHLRILKEAYDYHQDPRPNRKPPEVIGVGETSLFCVLARLVLLAPRTFIDAVEATSHSLDWLMQEWVSHFDSIGDIIRKKLQTLAITSLFNATMPPPPVMLEHLQSFMSVWTDVLTELGDEAAEESRGDYLWHPRPAESSEVPDESPEDGRKRLLSNHDPIYTTNLRDFVAGQLRLTIQACGGPARFEAEWLSRIDSAVTQAFAELKLL